MHHEKLLRKGISEMLAIVLGVAITIAIGVALFGLLPNYITSMTQQQRVAITQLSASKISSNTGIVTFTVKNLGTKDIANLTLTIFINGNQVSDIKPIAPNISVSGSNINISLAPGQEMGMTVQVTDSQVQVGAQVTVVIKATFIDGSSATASATTYIA
ncbi:MAG: hypothetical protein LM583_09340 [Desulfurococcaceae archaeon]|nr:hypothetical protein [Desulfurococcaceae archaeon]